MHAKYLILVSSEQSIFFHVFAVAYMACEKQTRFLSAFIKETLVEFTIYSSVNRLSHLSLRSVLILQSYTGALGWIC